MQSLLALHYYREYIFLDMKLIIACVVSSSGLLCWYNYLILDYFVNNCKPNFPLIIKLCRIDRIIALDHC